MRQVTDFEVFRRGERLRILRGHHPGSVVEVVCQRRHQVQLRGLAGNSARKRDPFWVQAAYLSANAERV